MVRRFPVVVVVLATLLVQCGCQRSQDGAPTPVAVADYVLFESQFYSFPYPSNWRTMDVDGVEKLVEVNLTPSGISKNAVVWAGGVYTGCPDPSSCGNAASVFAVVIHVSNFPGPMSDGQFSQLAANMESASQKSFGSRLRGFDLISVSSFRAIAVTALGKSGKQVIRNVTIYAKKDHAYLVFCGASQNQYDGFAGVFDDAIGRMEIKTD